MTQDPAGKLQNVEYRRARNDEWDTCVELAWRTFNEFEAPEYEPEGIENFREFVYDDVLVNMIANDVYKVFVAVYEGEIIGMISLRDVTHISLLFVDAAYHRRGVGRGLMSHLVTYVIYELDENKITVNAAPYATEFYHRMGFKDTDEQKVTEGITYTPMILDLS